MSHDLYRELILTAQQLRRVADDLHRSQDTEPAQLIASMLDTAEQMSAHAERIRKGAAADLPDGD